jgi:hypothetical protein
MTSFYMRTPSDFLVEYGWGGRDVNDATGQPQELPSVASFWGHDGLFRAVGGEDPPPIDLRPGAKQQAIRAPLQVLDGNYERLKGVCRGGTRSSQITWRIRHQGETDGSQATHKMWRATNGSRNTARHAPSRLI